MGFFLPGTVERVEGISLVCSLFLQLSSRSSAMSAVVLARGLALGLAFASMSTRFFFPGNTGTEYHLGVGLFVVFCLF